MKKFIIKGLVFMSPVIFLYGFMHLFYSVDKGDALRVGHIIDTDPDYRDVFESESPKQIHYTLLSEINLNNHHNYSVLTIGDSFSELGKVGYKNYLADIEGVNLLHYDLFINRNPIQTLNDVINGDLLDHINVKYIILQSVEREFVRRVARLDHNGKIEIDSLKAKIKKHIPKEEIYDHGKFFSDLIFQFPLYNIQYSFDDRAYDSDIYKIETTEKLFSGPNTDLLFYYEDLMVNPANGKPEMIRQLNAELNKLDKKLKAKNITLIVLPCPDKSDFYYDYIANQKKYSKPVFFEQMNNMQKDYIYLDSKALLNLKLKNTKDIYYYDDTHWSPFAAKVVADTLAKIINTHI